MKGRIEYDGKPAAGVLVYLMPVNAPRVPEIPKNPSARTNSDGTFELGTYKTEDGAPEGTYKLTLVWPKALASSEENARPVESDNPADQDQFLGWYDFAHSKISVRVEAGGTTIPLVKIPLISKPPEVMQGIPGMN